MIESAFLKIAGSLKIVPLDRAEFCLCLIYSKGEDYSIYDLIDYKNLNRYGYILNSINA
ncbi:hypothetical protein MICAK_2970009 [Microcystis aeruginosa PCC 9701]|jgi:hypothetical protein|uniref:Uncharacterized protein n=1 Tax=Microcystis aeruginosa PCC 9701 TaxID=721123 RepID=I4IRX1_MICAE|nr:hypothetical protein MICAK_2970009 [Microcystis aeruginosa PCC 9701]